MSMYMILSLIWLGTAHCFPKIENRDVYEIQEDKDLNSIKFVHPESLKPVLREITYYHLVEKPYQDGGNVVSNKEELDSSDSSEEDKTERPFTNGHGYQFIDNFPIVLNHDTTLSGVDDLVKWIFSEDSDDDKGSDDDNFDTDYEVEIDTEKERDNDPNISEKKTAEAVKEKVNIEPVEIKAVTTDNIVIVPAEDDILENGTKEKLETYRKQKDVKIKTNVGKDERSVEMEKQEPAKTHEVEAVTTTVEIMPKTTRSHQLFGSPEQLRERYQKMRNFIKVKEPAANDMYNKGDMNIRRKRSAIEEIPEAPILPELNPDDFPEYIQRILSTEKPFVKEERKIDADDEKYREEIKEKMEDMFDKITDDERTEDYIRNLPLDTEEDGIVNIPTNKVRTYGMNLKEDRGYVWNNLWSNPGMMYNVGDLETVKESKEIEDEKEEIEKLEPEPTTTRHKPTTHKPTTHKPTTHKPTTHKHTTHKPTTHKPTTTHKPITTHRPINTHKPITTHQPTTEKPITTETPHTTPKPSNPEDTKPVTEEEDVFNKAEEENSNNIFVDINKNEDKKETQLLQPVTNNQPEIEQKPQEPEMEQVSEDEKEEFEPMKEKGKRRKEENVPDTLSDLMKNEKFWKWLGDWTETYMDLLIQHIGKVVKEEISKQMNDIKEKEKVSIEELNKAEEKEVTNEKNRVEDDKEEPNDKIVNEKHINEPKDDENKDSIEKSDKKTIFIDGVELPLTKPSNFDINNELGDEKFLKNRKHKDEKKEVNVLKEKEPTKEIKVLSQNIYGNSLDNGKVTNMFFFFDQDHYKKSIEEINPLLNEKNTSKTENIIIDIRIKETNDTEKPKHEKQEIAPIKESSIQKPEEEENIESVGQTDKVSEDSNKEEKISPSPEKPSTEQTEKQEEIDNQDESGKEEEINEAEKQEDKGKEEVNDKDESGKEGEIKNKDEIEKKEKINETEKQNEDNDEEEINDKDETEKKEEINETEKQEDKGKEEINNKDESDKKEEINETEKQEDKGKEEINNKDESDKKEEINETEKQEEDKGQEDIDNKDESEKKDEINDTSNIETAKHEEKTSDS